MKWVVLVLSMLVVGIGSVFYANSQKIDGTFCGQIQDVDVKAKKVILDGKVYKLSRMAYYNSVLRQPEIGKPATVALMEDGNVVLDGMVDADELVAVLRYNYLGICWIITLIFFFALTGDVEQRGTV